MCQDPPLTHLLDHARGFPTVFESAMCWLPESSTISGLLVQPQLLENRCHFIARYMHRRMLIIVTRAALVIFNWKKVVVFVVFVITPVKR